jgi:hypothetical protein
MANNTLKVNNPIRIDYQSAAGVSGLTVQMDVYDETGNKDNSMSGVMVEKGTLGIYQKIFTPDVIGDWFIKITDSANGKVIKSFTIGSYDVDTVGIAVDGVVSTLVTMESNLNNPLMVF